MEKKGFPVETERILIYINGDTIGNGDEELGRVLMGTFLHSLKGLPCTPWRIVCINSGVKLTSGDSQHIALLKEIENNGTDILSCGTCLDYYHRKDTVGVGRISNMVEIATSFLESSKVITL